MSGMRRKSKEKENIDFCHTTSAIATTTTVVGVAPSSLSGPAAAWNIAFSDLKRRYWICQNDLILLKNANQNLVTELLHCKEHNQYLQKQNKHLEDVAATKATSYEKLEKLYTDTRKSEILKDKFTKELSEKIEHLMEERKLFQEQCSKMVEENQKLRNQHDILQREKKQLENEMEVVKNIPNISINPNPTAPPKRDNSKKLEELISENKHLKTSIHWLSDELHKLKNEKQNNVEKKVHLSGCLEEGFNSKLNFPKNIKNMDLPSYIKMLHNTIAVLKEQLKLSTKQLKKLISCKVSNDGLSSQENILIDSNYIKHCNSPVNSFSFEKLESGQIIGDETLPTPFSNLQTQQIQTYLKEKHIQGEAKPSTSHHLPEQFHPIIPGYSVGPLVISRRIRSYEEG